MHGGWIGALMVGAAALGSVTVAGVAAGSTIRCPAEMARVGGVCVDRWEASLVEVRGDGSVGNVSPFASPTGRSVMAVSRMGVTPQAHVSLLQARAACQEAGKRLCRGAEWKAACRGPEDTSYPYGNARVAGACVDSNRTAPLGRLYSPDAMYSPAAMNDPRLNQTPNTVAKTGEAAACTNAYGVYDMVGNVHEWADDGAFHGGYYLDVTQNREGCEYATTVHAVSYFDYSTGFRCCADEDSPAVRSVPEVETSIGPEGGAHEAAARSEGSEAAAASGADSSADHRRQVESGGGGRGPAPSRDEKALPATLALAEPPARGRSERGTRLAQA